jgi:cell division septation protein DedD
MSAEKGSSKTDTLVKVVLVFFISLLSFSVGTFVGKQVSDSDHRRLALEEGDHKTDRGIASVGAKEDDSSEHKISEKEIENLTEEFVNKEKTMKDGEEVAEQAASGHGEDAHAEKADTSHSGYKDFKRGLASSGHGTKEAAKASEHAAPAEHGKPAQKAGKNEHMDAVAEKVAAGKAPTDGSHREPQSKPPILPSVATTAVGKYTIQVASYIEESEAKTRAADLKGKGWNAFYIPANVKGRTYYRVSVGLFDDMGSANQFRGQFMREANTKEAIVQKVVQ